MSKRYDENDLSVQQRNLKETPPDFSQFKGKRLDKQPNLLVDGLVHAVLTGLGAALLLGIVYVLFNYINW
ncbi:hypothetical protein H1Q58_09095 [Planococcus maritimus]|uniref:Uncharacterized protein n=1 Tax=Planococcus maritimus TaxID=192421 RepID=A0A7D7RFX8_PLAMR|nr:hypothetical protein [Planococcus maritimus]KYG58833.1 hypothetical protein AY633_00900 [Planococcus maritimus]QMT16143.1 hypothetical protein H1Q58_09095 [Planococcus maritimus]